jgi:hypothetical protein
MRLAVGVVLLALATQAQAAECGCKSQCDAMWAEAGHTGDQG